MSMVWWVMPRTHETGKAFQGSEFKYWQCMQEMSVHHSFLLLNVYHLKTSPSTDTVPTKISWTCLIDPAVYSKPCLLVYLYVISLSPCSVVCNNLASLFNWIQEKHWASSKRGSSASPSESPVSLIPVSLYVCLCVSFLHRLADPNLGSHTQAVQDFPGSDLRKKIN